MTACIIEILVVYNNAIRNDRESTYYGIVPDATLSNIPSIPVYISLHH